MKISSSASLLSVLPFLVAACAADTGDSAEPTGAATQAVTSIPTCCNCLKANPGGTFLLGTNGVGANGGFETGNLTGWTTNTLGSTVPVVSSDRHSGRYAAQVGPWIGTYSSSIEQNFTAPANSIRLSVWYKLKGCTNYYYTLIRLLDRNTGYFADLLPTTCTVSTSWIQATATLIPGHRYTLSMEGGDRDSYVLVDDVAYTVGGTTCPISGCSAVILNYCPTAGGGVCTFRNGSTTGTYTCSGTTYP